MTNNLMIDIETLGTGANAVVISIGAILFNPETGELGESIYRKLNYQDQVDKGRKITESTVSWWMDQSVEAREVFNEEGVSTEQALNELKALCETCEFVKPWGNGPSFDLTILESLYKDFGHTEFPWHFRHVRCLRTFKEYIYDGKDIERVGVYHHALDDCKYQIKVVVEGLKR